MIRDGFDSMKDPLHMMMEDAKSPDHASASSTPRLPSAIPASHTMSSLPAAIQTIAADAGAPICLMDSAGRVLAFNTAWTNYQNAPDSQLQIGASLDQLYPSDMAAERLEALRDVLNGAQSVKLLGFCRGKLVLVTHRPFIAAESSNSNQLQILAIGQPIASRDHYLKLLHDPAVRKCRANSAGELSGLKLRQLEVLRMIGLGKSTADMAKALHRSVKTIEFHRVALGQRLGLGNRVDLANVAQRSGLVHLDNDEIPLWWRRAMFDSAAKPVSLDHDPLDN